MNRSNVKAGDTVYLRPGIGFWDVSDYPIGGCFDRNGNEPMEIKVTAVFEPEPVKHCDATGKITGEKPAGKIAFSLENAVTQEEAEQITAEDKAKAEAEERSYCDYQIWNRATGQLENCGTVVTDIETAHLCSEHLAFVEDSQKGYQARKPHPAGFNWLRKAWQAYGVNPSAVLHAMPSDAGKPDNRPDPDVEEWNAQAPRYNNDGSLYQYAPPAVAVNVAAVMLAILGNPAGSGYWRRALPGDRARGRSPAS